MRVICRTLNWSSTMRTLRAAANGIPITPDSTAVHQLAARASLLACGSRCRCQGTSESRGDCPGWGKLIGREFREFLDVEDEGDTAVAEDRGRGDARDRAVTLLDALDHHLLVAQELVDNETEASAFPRLGDNHDTFAKVFDRAGDIEEVGKMNER